MNTAKNKTKTIKTTTTPAKGKTRKGAHKKTTPAATDQQDCITITTEHIDAMDAANSSHMTETARIWQEVWQAPKQTIETAIKEHCENGGAIPLDAVITAIIMVQHHCEDVRLVSIPGVRAMRIAYNNRVAITQRALVLLGWVAKQRGVDVAPLDAALQSMQPDGAIWGANPDAVFPETMQPSDRDRLRDTLSRLKHPAAEPLASGKDAPEIREVGLMTVYRDFDLVVYKGKDHRLDRDSQARFVLKYLDSEKAFNRDSRKHKSDIHAALKKAGICGSTEWKPVDAFKNKLKPLFDVLDNYAGGYWIK